VAPEFAPDRTPTRATSTQGERGIVREVASRRTGTTPVSARGGNAGADRHFIAVYIESADTAILMAGAGVNKWRLFGAGYGW